jgi:S-adenosylmethionine synthetase
MPLPITLAHALMRRHKAVRGTAEGDLLGPDAKAQGTVRYADGAPVAVTSVLLSTQHARGTSRQKLEELVRERIIAPVIPRQYLGPGTRYLVNPTGVFEIGGPIADAGVTGRKIIVDTYGGAARHGGGAFSGKDPTKVDRSAAYGARQIARTIVANGWAEQAELQVAYAIGVAEPVSLCIHTFGTETVDERSLHAIVEEICSPLLTPRSIIERLDLRRPIYRPTAAFGHFGRDDLGLSWERPVTELRPDLLAANRDVA